MKELDQQANYSAPSRPGEHPFAVLYQGEYETPWDGTAVAVRMNARALKAAGVPVLLRSFSGLTINAAGFPSSVAFEGVPAVVKEEIGDLDETTAQSFFPIVRHLVVRNAEHLRQAVIPRGAVPYGQDITSEVAMREHLYSSTIVYSVWERDRVDPAIVKILSRCAECWVPSEQNRRMLINSGVLPERVVIVPHAYDPADSIHKLRRRIPSPGWKRFYTIGRWEPRKGQVRLLQAFLRAFKPTDQATLTIKYTGGNWTDYATPDQALQRALGMPEARANGWTFNNIATRVSLVEGRLPRSEILKLHYMNNLYVSAAHGEAWCLPAFEAALAGNRLVYVPSGGVEDFATYEDEAVELWQSRHEDEDARLESVPASYGWEADAKWFAVPVDHLANALREVKAPPSYNRTSLTRYSMEKVGALMRERLQKIASTRPTAHAFYEGLGK